MLQAFLDFQRATVVAKVTGLTDADARRPLLPTSQELTPAGLVRHLTAVERAWFRIVLAAEPVDDMAAPGDPKAMLVADAPLASLVRAYRDECRAADRAASSFALDDRVRAPERSETLRWVYFHMIEETARHLGHLDLLRESIDGTVGE